MRIYIKCISEFWKEVFSYSFPDLQLLPRKYVLLDPSRIVAPIWVLEPCGSVVQSIWIC